MDLDTINNYRNEIAKDQEILEQKKIKLKQMLETLWFECEHNTDPSKWKYYRESGPYGDRMKQCTICHKEEYA